MCHQVLSHRQVVLSLLALVVLLVAGGQTAWSITIVVDAFGGTVQYSTEPGIWNNVSVGDRYSDCTQIMIRVGSWLSWHREGECPNTASTRSAGVYHVGTTIGTSAGFMDLIEPDLALVIHNGPLCIETDNCGLALCNQCVWPDFSNPFALAYPYGSTGFQTVLYGATMQSEGIFWNMPESSSPAMVRVESPLSGYQVDLFRNQWVMLNLSGHPVNQGEGQPPGYGPPYYGACCLPDQTCRILAQDVCIGSGGAYVGDDIGCDPDPCPASSVGIAASEGRLMLGTPVPNPATGAIAYSVTLPQVGMVRVQVCDVSGEIVATLIDRELKAGLHTFSWDFRGVGLQRPASGIYHLRMEVGGVVQSRSFVVLR